MISLIDDDDGVREATAGLLRSLGYTVHAFASARAFLNWSELSKTRCVITDIMMPDIDGFELHRRLTADGHQFPVIYLTAISEESAKARMINHGARYILLKPCPEQHLIACVDAALQSPRNSQ